MHRIYKQKKPRHFCRGMCSHCCLSGKSKYCLCRPQVSGGHLQAKKEPGFLLTLLCSHYLSSREVQVLSSPYKNMPVACFRREKTPHECVELVFALPIFPGSHPPSIVGANELNFCVRDGNRWTLIAINTNSLPEEVFPFLYSAVSRISVIHRTSSFFTLVTHTGFEPMLTA